MLNDNSNMIDEAALEVAISFDHLPEEYHKYLNAIKDKEPNAYAYLYKNITEMIQSISEQHEGLFSEYPILVNHLTTLMLLTTFKGMVLGELRWKPKLDFTPTGKYTIQPEDFE